MVAVLAVKTLESTDQKAVVSYLRKNKIFFFAPILENLYMRWIIKFVTKLIRNKIEAEYTRLGRIKGTPDLFIFLSKGLLIIELKRFQDGKKLGVVSDEQSEFLDKAKEFSWVTVSVCYGYEHAIEIIEGLR